jgi:hypothetical protein
MDGNNEMDDFVHIFSRDGLWLQKLAATYTTKVVLAILVSLSFLI